MFLQHRDQSRRRPARHLRNVLGGRLGQVVETELAVRSSHVHAIQRQKVRVHVEPERRGAYHPSDSAADGVEAASENPEKTAANAPSEASEDCSLFVANTGSNQRNGHKAEKAPAALSRVNSASQVRGQNRPLDTWIFNPRSEGGKCRDALGKKETAQGRVADL
jgi:hypothetical protein